MMAVGKGKRLSYKRCPKCGAEIDHLRVISEEVGELRMADGEPEYEWSSEIYGDSVVSMKFMCPECDEVLFIDPYEAAQFLSD